MTSNRSLWDIADAIATVLACAAVAARSRLLEHASAAVRLMTQRDELFGEAALLERELAVFRSQRLRLPRCERPHYTPEARAEILQLMWLRGWLAKQTSQRFVLHRNTISNWQRALGDKLRAEHVLGVPPWNRLHDGVRWTVQELRRLSPEPSLAHGPLRAT